MKVSKYLKLTGNVNTFKRLAKNIPEKPFRYTYHSPIKFQSPQLPENTISAESNEINPTPYNKAKIGVSRHIYIANTIPNNNLRKDINGTIIRKSYIKTGNTDKELTNVGYKKTIDTNIGIKLVKSGYGFKIVRV